MRGAHVVRWLRLVTIGGAALYPAVYVTLALLRIGHPFELEWMEGGCLDHVRRVLGGEPVYAPPTLEYVPYIYTPLYYYLCAPVARALGLGFLPLRLVSLLASLACFGVVFHIVRRETGRRLPAALAACLLAATYRESATFFDVARADSLHLLFLLVAIGVARFRSSAASAAACGVVVALAFLTKQPGLLAAPALLCLHLRRGWRQAGAFVAAVALSLGAATLVLDRLNDGWFHYYVFGLTGQHPPVMRVLVTFWARDLLSPLALAALLTLAGLQLRCQRGEAAAAIDWSLLLAALVSASLGARLNIASDVNVLMPAHAALALGLGLAWRELERALPLWPRAAEAFAWTVLLAQFVRLLYEPTARVPTRADRQAGEELVRSLSSLPGPVFVPNHPYLLPRAGHPWHAHQMAVNDVLLNERGPWRARVAEPMRAAIRERRYGAIVLDDWFWFRSDVVACYRPLRPAFAGPRVFWTVAGARMRPQTIYVPAESCR